MAHYDKATELFASAGDDISKYGNPGEDKVMKLKMDIPLEAGKSVTIFEADKPGRIIGIKIKPAVSLGGKARDIVLRAYWDSDPEPAINCPVGDFFGYAWGEPAMRSLMIGTNDQNENYCYFPMPFRETAKMELFSEGDIDKSLSLQVEIIYSSVGLRENEGKFYSVWRRENPTTKEKPFTFIDTKGQGHIVGAIQQSQGMETGNTYYFEGDDQTTIDGELVVHGTGSEDFYNGGWYDVPGRWEARVSRPLSGCLDYKKHLGRTGGYRIMLGDVYAYRESILQTIEHAPENNELINDYVGVTYFYSLNRPACDMSLPRIADRKVTDPKKLKFATWWNVPVYSSSINNAVIEKRSSGIETEGGWDVRVLSFRGKEEDFFGLHSISFTCEFPASGTYDVSIDVVKGPGQGIIQIFRDEAAVGNEADLYSETMAVSEGITMGRLEFTEGKNQVMFKITGKNDNSEGLGFDLTNIIFDLVE